MKTKKLYIVRIKVGDELIETKCRQLAKAKRIQQEYLKQYGDTGVIWIYYYDE